jgi:cysteinyl-tRNA synthetase
MSKSLGNFYTLRDLFDKGFAAESVRYLLASVPHRKQLNFTFDGLRAAATSIERLRNFKRRLETGRFPEGQDPEITKLADEARRQFEAGMDDDLNTAQALGAVFEFVRAANTRMDAGKFPDGNLADATSVLDLFDSIFDVLRPEVGGAVTRQQTQTAVTRIAPSSEEIEKLIAERLAARKSRNFARSDEIRDELKQKGVVLEDTRDGTRWKYAGT